MLKPDTIFEELTLLMEMTSRSIRQDEQDLQDKIHYRSPVILSFLLILSGSGAQTVFFADFFRLETVFAFVGLSITCFGDSGL